MNWFKRAYNTLSILISLKPLMAEAAQKEYDEWEQDKEGLDEMLGGGGICDQIANRISDVIVSNTDFDIAMGGAEGEDHAWVLVKTPEGIYEIDIHPGIYESGGGYSWTKIPDVEITKDDIYIGFLGDNPEYWPEDL